MPLHSLRTQIQEIDEQILTLIAKRNELCKQIATHKHEHKLPIHDEVQAEAKEKKMVAFGRSLKLTARFVRRFWRLIHHNSVKLQEEFLQKNVKKNVKIDADEE